MNELNNARIRAIVVLYHSKYLVESLLLNFFKNISCLEQAIFGQNDSKSFHCIVYAVVEAEHTIKY